MKRTLSKCFVCLMIVLAVSVPCFANQNLKISHDQSQVSDNYYVQPGGVYIAPNGIYASIDGTLIQVDTLCSDARGVFVPYTEIVGKLVRCPFCRHWYDPDQGHNCSGTFE